MLDLQKLTAIDPKIIVLGSYPSIIQSMLDFDYLSGRDSSSIKAIISNSSRRYFWGNNETLLPTFSSLSEARGIEPNLFLNVSSARRVLSLTKEVFEVFPSIIGGVIFAEDTPEKHSLELKSIAEKHGGFIIGPSSIGILIPSHLKLGPIGGVGLSQLKEDHFYQAGDTAVLSASGGMTNELINIVTKNNGRISFAMSFGGDRFPVTTPSEAFEQAQKDENTKRIVYYGELGGYDEYELVKDIQASKITKPVYAYVAGTIADLFETPPQFGHAKAMAKMGNESARAKRDALKSVGVHVAESIGQLEEMIAKDAQVLNNKGMDTTGRSQDINENRKQAMFASTLVNFPLHELSKDHSYAYIVTSLFLGKPVKSKELEEFAEMVFKLVADHGPHVSGAVNTMITARAGRDLPSSIASGLLTIGPRFGGAINQAAANWFSGVQDNTDPHTFVENFASKKQYIQGIGHKKYRIDLPDPRVTDIVEFANKLSDPKYTRFAQSVEQITTQKKGNLILNVDGAIAAVLLDILTEKEQLSETAIEQLIDVEFFNAFFVFGRTAGLIAHFLDQKRLDEGLFRLPDDEVANI